MAGPSSTIHGTAVRYADQAVILIGASGSGKSSLALQLLGLGAQLIADDRVVLNPADDRPVASCPPTIEGLIEARGVGILNTPAAEPAPVALVVDMDTEETERLPVQRNVTLGGHILPLLWHIRSPHFPVTLLHILRYGRSTR